METAAVRSAGSSVSSLLDRPFHTDRHRDSRTDRHRDSSSVAAGLPGLPQRQMLVFAHRGLAGPGRSENSVRAVEAALNCGADGVEVDVRLTSDGVLVCSHGDALGTTDGRDLVVSRSSAAELRRAARDKDERLASLVEVLAAVSRHGYSRLVVEAKPVRDRVAARRTALALRRVLLVGRPHGAGVTVSSFDPVLLAEVRGAVPVASARTALLGSTGEPAHAVLARAVADGHDEVHLSLAAVRRSPHVIWLAHRLGVGVTVWTVNCRDDLRLLAQWGADAVITDDVMTAGVVLGEPSPGSTIGMATGAAC